LIVLIVGLLCVSASPFFDHCPFGCPAGPGPCLCPTSLAGVFAFVGGVALIVVSIILFALGEPKIRGEIN